VALSYFVISARQMTVTWPQAQGGLQTFNLPLFLVTLMRNESIRNI
jgi:hypothetical protein